ncbi:hypothetical protein [Streptomyces sp. NPDC051909]|uniref:hypothetical protein n=1 Tax=Streptomyces sp. NPDC051909 TaxID=3154944 RepID=UPI00344AF950
MKHPVGDESVPDRVFCVADTIVSTARAENGGQGVADTTEPAEARTVDAGTSCSRSRLRRRENDETDFRYPPLTCTISESDLLPPV